MATIRETQWFDGADYEDDEAIQKVLQMAQFIALAGGGMCAVCLAKQPDDVKWPSFSFELEAKEDGESHEICFATCKACEPQMDALMSQLDGEA